MNKIVSFGNMKANGILLITTSSKSFDMHASMHKNHACITFQISNLPRSFLCTSHSCISDHSLIESIPSIYLLVLLISGYDQYSPTSSNTNCIWISRTSRDRETIPTWDSKQRNGKDRHGVSSSKSWKQSSPSGLQASLPFNNICSTIQKAWKPQSLKRNLR